jgi:2-succinyl-5-enolpyruvyl-6-hydroxy-3-cyclohexene-1-carboxylate synthase
MTIYTATAAFVRALVARGCTHAVVSPGLRSAPLALSAHVGGFTALGIAKATGRPVLVVCTSGSAVANLLPAVVEARHARVPLVIATGDRPPELHGWDSPQTIDQVGIFGSFADTIEMPVGDEVDEREVDALAGVAWGRSTDIPAGPVHVNWPFREPLEPTGALRMTPGEPVAEPTSAATNAVDPGVVEAVATASRGVIAAGELTDDEEAATRRLAARTGWPVVADPLSGLRTDASDPAVITTADHLLAVRGWADAHVPDVVLRVGSPPTSKSLRLWMERTRPKRVVVVDPGGRRRDPSRTMTDLVVADVAAFATAVACDRPSSEPGWSASWAMAEQRARMIVSDVAASSFEEAAATRHTAAILDENVAWHVASSTPIRDVDWYVHATRARVSANRGANGIDGTVSTANGIALGSGRPVVVTLGDVAAMHDAGGILATRTMERPPVVVVYANGGGGIFSLLPIAGATDPAAFASMLHTPVDVDFGELAGAAGLRHVRAADAATLDGAVRSGLAGERLFIEVAVDVEGTRRQLSVVRSELDAAL